MSDPLPEFTHGHDLPEFLRGLRPQSTAERLTTITGKPPTEAQTALAVRYPALLQILKATP